jgi:hypothetical protein
MALFARVIDGIVENIIVAEQDYIDTLPDKELYIEMDPTIRKNHVGVGDTYDVVRDAFYLAKPYAQWVLNEDTCVWEPPFPPPYFWSIWDENTGSWFTESPEIEEAQRFAQGVLNGIN